MRILVILVTPEKGAIKLQEPRLAESILSFVEKRQNTQHFKTVLAKHPVSCNNYEKEIRLLQELCRRMQRHGFMPKFFSGSKAAHGSLALRIGKEDAFLITARGSEKKSLQAHDVVLVRRIDWRRKNIIVESSMGRKASFNAVLAAAIFKKFPHINAVVHAHRFARNTPTTTFPHTPGTRSIPFVYGRQ